MKHVKLFESFDGEGSEEGYLTPWTESIEIPEGYMIDFYRTDKPEDWMAYYERAGVQDWSGLDYEQWKETINDMGTQKYEDGRQYFRGRISWDEMGISINYEIHPV
jgi:hypothetical protein